MSKSNPSDLPLWVRDRDTFLKAASEDKTIDWRYVEEPDYSRQNKSFAREASFNFPKESLEAIVHNLVRNLDVETSYKKDPSQWLTIVNDKFNLKSNNSSPYTAEDLAERGTYNLLIEKNEHYDPSKEDYESGSQTFHTAFPNGFLWELTEILSPPPRVTFKLRHWGKFSGNYKNYFPTGEVIEVVGVSIVEIPEDYKLLSVEHFFDNSKFLNKLTKGCPMHSENQTED